MAFGHHSSASSVNLWLDGVEFKLSEFYSVKSVSLPQNFDLKDADVLLSEFEYDFSNEKILIRNIQAKEHDDKKRHLHAKERKNAEREKHKQQLAEKHKEFLEMQKQKTEAESKLPSMLIESKRKVNVSPNNLFYNDMIGSLILTPEPAKPINGDTPKQLQSVKSDVDVQDFETENPDPFSNAELQTIDDRKELEDVLQNITLGDNERSYATSKLNDHAKQPNHDILDEFTDLLTSDIKDTEESVVDQQKHHSSTNSINFGKQSSSGCTMVSMSNTTTPTSNHSNFTADCTVSSTRTSTHSDEATINTAHENDYVNLPCTAINRPSVPPRPTPRRKYLLEDTEPVTTAKERERFEKTINKALTSLPKLPKSLPNEKEKTETPGFRDGLTKQENNFALHVVSMGFNEYNVLQGMQKFGLNIKAYSKYHVLFGAEVMVIYPCNLATTVEWGSTYSLRWLLSIFVLYRDYRRETTV
uniref:UMA domain-containing protein n=1 Tax=Ciona intestinalis TaxID=7719 RepID=F6U568_CIOIN